MLIVSFFVANNILFTYDASAWQYVLHVRLNKIEFAAPSVTDLNESLLKSFILQK